MVATYLPMQDPSQPSINSWLEDELFQQFQYDKQAVDKAWKQEFDTNGHAPELKHANGHNGAAPTMTVLETKALPAPAPAPPEIPTVPISPGDQLVPLRGPALRI